MILTIGRKLFSTFGGGSNGGNGGGRVVKARFITPLDISRMTQGQRSELKMKKRRVLEVGEKLHSDCVAQDFSLNALHVEGQRLLRELFHPDRTSIAIEEDQEFPALNKVIEASLRENRVVCIPHLGKDNVYVTGNKVGKLYDLFSTRSDSLEIDPTSLENLPFRSVMVAPLVTGLNRVRPVSEYDRHGAIVLCSREAGRIDPLVDLAPLRMYADYFAIAYDHLNRTA